MAKVLYSSRDLTRTVLAAIVLVALIVSSVWIVRPFLSAFLWASMIVIATWPLMLRIQARLGGRRGLATAIMTLALLLVLLVPLSLAIGALIAHMDEIVAQAKTLSSFELPPPPSWVANLPFQGPEIADEWQRLSLAGPAGLSAKVAPYAGRMVEWAAGHLGGMGGLLLQFFLTVIISAVLYANGEVAAAGVRKFAQRLAGDNGDRAAVLAAGTIRGVAMGVVLTAIIQTMIAGTGLALAAVPGAGVLAAAALILCIAQLGPVLAMLPAIIWKFYMGDSFWGIGLIIFALVAGTVDNFIRPVLIRKGADLPLLLIIAGVIGGLISFGVMGIFIGPVILAVTYKLLGDWVDRVPEEEQHATVGGPSAAASA